MIISPTAADHDLRFALHEGSRRHEAHDEVLYTASQWPRPAYPADLEHRFTFEMVRSGHVLWRVDGAPPKRGWLMLKQESR